MLLSNCCDYPSAFEINEINGLYGHCDKCGEHATFYDDDNIEHEMNLSNFLDNGGTELGYDRENYPDSADFNDVLINEIKLEIYKQLTNEEK